jgi:hypothetical protein
LVSFGNHSTSQRADDFASKELGNTFTVKGKWVPRSEGWLPRNKNGKVTPFETYQEAGEYLEYMTHCMQEWDILEYFTLSVAEFAENWVVFCKLRGSAFGGDYEYFIKDGDKVKIYDEFEDAYVKARKEELSKNTMPLRGREYTICFVKPHTK